MGDDETLRLPDIARDGDCDRGELGMDLVMTDGITMVAGGFDLTATTSSNSLDLEPDDDDDDVEDDFDFTAREPLTCCWLPLVAPEAPSAEPPGRLEWTSGAPTA